MRSKPEPSIAHSFTQSGVPAEARRTVGIPSRLSIMVSALRRMRKDLSKRMRRRWVRSRHSERRLREHYLTVVEAALAGVIGEDPPLPAIGGERPFDFNVRAVGLDWPSKAMTMIGVKRLRNFRDIIEMAIHEKVPGDIIETGVWRGGASILARAVLLAHGVADRRVILADSFEGLPPPDAHKYPADAGSTFHEYRDLSVPLETVQANFRKFDLLDEQVVFLKGWFKDTIATAPTDKLAVIRLDGDMYESTIIVLDHLYDRLSRGGWVIVDDYEVVPACKAAVTDFLARRRLAPEIVAIDGVGVYFQKA